MNLTSINLTLYQSLTQAQEAILVLYKQLQALQAQKNAKRPATEKPVTDKKTGDKKSKRYFWTHRRNRILEHTRPTYCYTKEGN